MEHRMRIRPILSAGSFAFLLLAMGSSGLAADQEVQGMVVSRDGSNLVVRVNGTDRTFRLLETTKIEAAVGLFGASRETHSRSSLINGLAVQIEYVDNQGELDATEIMFKPSDYKTAEAIQAGVAQGRQRIIERDQENQRRFSQIGQFAEKGRIRVYFATGSAAISAKGADDLRAFVQQQAMPLPNYLLRVVGHTDSTGSAAVNQRLSDQRATAVTAFLLQSCNVPHTRIVGAAGLGSYVPVDENVSTEGKAQNRRVTVFLLVSKASEPMSAN
jgi:outer membrane protein OmpA-like peptidoglycan-associated protein